MLIEKKNLTNSKNSCIIILLKIKIKEHALENKIVSNISAAGMLRILCNYKKTGIYNIESRERKIEIHIYEGNILKVLPAEKNAKETLTDVLSSTDNVSFYFEEQNVKQGTSLEICVEDVILESARRIAKHSRDGLLKDFLFQNNEVLKIAKFPKDKTVYIKFTSEEWNLLSSFDGNKSINTVIEETGINREKAEATLYGLLSAGLLRRTRFKMPELTKIVREEIGNVGVAIIDTEIYKNKIDRTKMGMKEFLRLLAALENSFSEIVGQTKARTIIEKIWETTK